MRNAFNRLARAVLATEPEKRERVRGKADNACLAVAALMLCLQAVGLPLPEHTPCSATLLVCAVPFSRHLRAYSIALGKAKAAALCLCACALSVALPLAIGEGAWLLMALIMPLCTVSMALLRSKVPFPEIANRESDIMSAAQAEADSIGSVCAATSARRAKGRRL